MDRADGRSSLLPTAPFCESDGADGDGAGRGRHSSFLWTTSPPARSLARRAGAIADEADEKLAREEEEEAEEKTTNDHFTTSTDNETAQPEEDRPAQSREGRDTQGWTLIFDQPNAARGSA